MKIILVLLAGAISIYACSGEAQTLTVHKVKKHKRHRKTQEEIRIAEFRRLTKEASTPDSHTPGHKRVFEMRRDTPADPDPSHPGFWSTTKGQVTKKKSNAEQEVERLRKEVDRLNKNAEDLKASEANNYPDEAKGQTLLWNSDCECWRSQLDPEKHFKWENAHDRWVRIQ
jgi:hypothetical protein